MKLAYVFAGQGRRPTRGQLELALGLPAGPALLEAAAAAAGLGGIADFLARGGRALDATSALQPLVVSLSLAIAAVLPDPDVVAGHSLGELSAASAMGALEPVEAVRLAALRGAVMQAASELRRGGLCAIDPARKEEALVLAGAEAFVALDNAPDELVLGAPEAAIATISRRVGGRRLDVAGPFHGPAMLPAAAQLREAASSLRWCSLRRPLLSAVDVELLHAAADARDRLFRGVASPVRFREVLQRLEREGARTFVVVGPGATVRSLLRRNLPASIAVLTTESPAELEQVRRAWEAA